MHDEHFERLQYQVNNHALYGYLNDPQHLRTFMEAHVFAVWDFMSLAKRLQIELTCTTLPWFTPDDARKARFINEIILAEESDIGSDGHPISHFDIYRLAMGDLGASTHRFDVFAEALRSGATLDAALAKGRVPAHISQFVKATLDTALHGSPAQVASSFFHGREDALPRIFQSLLENWQLSEVDAPNFVLYLQRHIELDGDEHGPAAEQILADFITDPLSEAAARRAAQEALTARLALWDGILADMQAGASAASLSYLQLFDE